MPHCPTTWHYIPGLHIFDSDLQLAVNGGGGFEKHFGMFICLQDMHRTNVQCDEYIGAMNVKH